MTDKANADEVLASIPQAWEQLVDEGAPAFAAFQVYRDLPPQVRTIRRAAEDAWEQPRRGRGKFDTFEARFERWAAGNAWRTRAQQWDAHLDRARREAQILAARDMGERHAEAAMLLIKKGLDALDTVKVAEMSVSDTLRFVEVGIKLERLARGEVDTESLPDIPEESPQDTIRALLESDPEVAKAGARFGSQILRVRRERESND